MRVGFFGFVGGGLLSGGDVGVVVALSEGGETRFCVVEEDDVPVPVPVPVPELSAC